MDYATASRLSLNLSPKSYRTTPSTMYANTSDIMAAVQVIAYCTHSHTPRPRTVPVQYAPNLHLVSSLPARARLRADVLPVRTPRSLSAKVVEQKIHTRNFRGSKGLLLDTLLSGGLGVPPASIVSGAGS